MSFTPAQQGLYRPLVERAWRAYCDRTNCSPHADGFRETWYRQQIYEVCGVNTTKDCNNTEDFDFLLIRFATIAGDEHMIAHATASAERRMRWVINKKLAEIEKLEGRPVSWRYAQALYAQMSSHHLLPDDINDCPAALLRKVVQALDTHARRLRRHGVAHV